MAKNIKGITIELEADSSGIKKALKEVDKASQGTTKELGQINRALKFDNGNQTLLAQKFDVLQDAISNTTTRLDALKSAQKDVAAQFKSGKIDASTYREFQREIEKTEGILKGFKNQADNVKAKVSVQADTTGIDKMKSELKSLGPEAKQAGKEIASGLATGAAAGAAGMGAIAIGSQEMNTGLARLSTNAEIAGRDISTVEDAFKQVAAISGETDSAIETVSNLLATGFNDEQLSSVIDNINGAAIKFSDTLKTEGIADGIQETFATGSAVGQFGELLERSGVNLDTFNEGLASAKVNGTETNYMLDQMAKLGLTNVTDKYKEMNKEVVDSNEANINMQVALADLGKAITPLITQITKIITAFAKWASENPGFAKALTVVMGVIGAVGGAITFLGPIIKTAIDLFGKFGKFLPHLGKLFTGLSGPIGWVILILTTAVPLIIKYWEPITGFFKAIWDGIINIFKTVGGAIVEFFKENWDLILTIIKGPIWFLVSFVKDNWDAIKASTIGIFNNIKEFLSGVITNIVDGAVNKFKLFKDTIVNVFTSVKERIKSIWEGVTGIIKAPINAMIKLINEFIRGVNKIKVPNWVPKVGGKGISIPEIPMLAKGTKYFRGGSAIVGENGPELVTMPTGAKVHTANQTSDMLGGNGVNINVASLVVREEADIKRIARELYNLQQVNNRGR